MKYRTTERMICGDVVREETKEVEFDSFEDFQEYLFLTGMDEGVGEFVDDALEGMRYDGEEEDDEDGY